MPEHFKESYLYGTFFAVTAASQAAFALIIWLHAKPTFLRAGLAGNTAVVLLWAYTRLVEVPIGPGRGSTEEIGRLDIVATTAEVLIVVACACLLVQIRQSRPGSLVSRPRPAAGAAAP